MDKRLQAGQGVSTAGTSKRLQTRDKRVQIGAGARDFRQEASSRDKTLEADGQ